jgi:hypothetical protein
MEVRCEVRYCFFCKLGKCVAEPLTMKDSGDEYVRPVCGSYQQGPSQEVEYEGPDYGP